MSTETEFPTLVVDRDHDGRRLDRFLQASVPGAGFGLVQKLIRKGAVRLDGKRVKADARVEAGQSVSLPRSLAELMQAVETPSETDVLTLQETQVLEALKSRVIADQHDVLVLDKPAGLAVQGGSKTRVHVDGLLSHFADAEGRSPKLVHRLDRDTSGVLLTARGASAAVLGKQFASRETKKRYLALCWGVPDEDVGRVDAALLKRAGRDGNERVVVDRAQGQHAISTYRVIGSGRLSDRQGPRLSLVEWSPLTGRTHQLRVHAAHLGNSIVGDPKYGHAPKLDRGEDDQAMVAGLGLMLHAASIEIEVAGKRRRFAAPIPQTFVQIAQRLGFELGIDTDNIGG